MKRVSVACFLLVLFAKFAFAQNTKISLVIVNTPYFSGYTSINDPVAKYDPVNKGDIYIPIKSNHIGSCTLNIAEPEFVELSSIYSLEKGAKENEDFSYIFFLMPGDNITLKIDLSKKSNNVVITGKGSNNNQPETAALLNMNTEKFSKDATPTRILAAINRQQLRNKIILSNYILKYKPSESFIRNSKLNLDYFAARIFYEFKADHQKGMSLPNNKWQKTQDSLFATIKFNNDAALASYNYTHLISSFVFQENEILDQEQDRVINRYFTGKTGEYLYADLLKNNIYESSYKNIASIFEHFKKKYPTSKYIADFSSTINAIAKKQNQTLNNKMVFVANNGTKLNTLREILALTKGKTVLVDMWGTWCSPCRQGIEENSAYIRACFKDKNVEFLYIDNNDLQNEKGWKKLIAYYQIEGVHILANNKLNTDIMSKIKSDEYPTYFIIKKDGSYQKIETDQQTERQLLINGLETALR